MTTGGSGGRRSLAEGLENGDAAGRIGSPPGAGRRRAVIITASTIMVLVALAISLVQWFRAPADPGDASRERVAVDARTGEVFLRLRIREGESQPWTNPKTGERTLYPGEPCFWTREGGAKITPTWVLLNPYAGRDGPTICPDCGRQVVPHNPTPPLDLMNAAAKAQRAGK